MRLFGNVDAKQGHFYDQIWLNAAPAFIPDLFVLRHRGYNAANWNLHERKLLKEDGKYFINATEEALVFFHFSHLKEQNLPFIASYNKDFTLDNRPDIKPIFETYIENLKRAGIEQLKTIPYKYGRVVERKVDNSLTGKLKRTPIGRFGGRLKKAAYIMFK